jgi:ComF family protein
LQQEPSFDGTYAPFIYQEEIRHLITGLKFGNQFKNARLLGLLLAEAIPEAGHKPDCLIPVPLHPARYRERGFNQAFEIARTAGTALNIPLNTGSCTRLKDTPHQTGLSARQRRKNLRQAFAVVIPLTAPYVAIVDDVMTTGSTAEMLTKALKKAGVNRVDIWVCARA